MSQYIFSRYVTRNESAEYDAKLRNNLIRGNLSLPEFLDHVSQNIYVDKFTDARLERNSTGRRWNKVRLEGSAHWKLFDYGKCLVFEEPTSIRNGMEVTDVMLWFQQKDFLGGWDRNAAKRFETGALCLGHFVYNLDCVKTRIKSGYSTWISLSEKRLQMLHTWTKPCAKEEGEEAKRRLLSRCVRDVRIKIGCTPIISFDQERRPLEEYCNLQSNPTVKAEFETCVVVNTQDKLPPCKKTIHKALITEVTVKNKGTVVRLTHDDGAKIEIVKEYRLYTWQSFLAKIGGVLSLLCGASLISLLEAAEGCLNYIRKAFVVKYV